jgi:hypothetical protein
MEESELRKAEASKAFGHSQLRFDSFLVLLIDRFLFSFTASLLTVFTLSILKSL